MADDWATYQFGAIRIRTLSDLLDAIRACTSSGLGENTVAGTRHIAFMRSAASMLSIQAGTAIDETSIGFLFRIDSRTVALRLGPSASLQTILEFDRGIRLLKDHAQAFRCLHLRVIHEGVRSVGPLSKEMLTELRGFVARPHNDK